MRRFKVVFALRSAAHVDHTIWYRVEARDAASATRAGVRALGSDPEAPHGDLRRITVTMERVVAP